jgi:hypothetical protein
MPMMDQAHGRQRAGRDLLAVGPKEQQRAERPHRCQQQEGRTENDTFVSPAPDLAHHAAKVERHRDSFDQDHRDSGGDERGLAMLLPGPRRQQPERNGLYSV